MHGLVRVCAIVAGAAAILAVSGAGCANGLVDVGGDDSGVGPSGEGGPGPDACSAMCSGKCVDTKSDPANCGKCGNACPMGATCVQGNCQCGAAQKCGGVCVDTKTDVSNCGSCGNSCTAEGGAISGGGKWACTNGTCSVTCPMGTTDCPSNGVDACVDTKTDNNNCGMCGNACAAMTEQCTQGQCCKVGQTICNNACTDTNSDPNNCGVCGKMCSGMTPGCSMGVCSAYVDHGPMHTFVNMTTDHYITQGCCSVGCAGVDATDADYFCKHFYGNNCSVLPGYVKQTTPTPTYPKMHKNGGCTSNGSDIPNTTCDSGACKIGNWSETTQGLANLICRCL